MPPTPPNQPPTFYYCCEHCRTPCSYGPRNHMTQCGWAGCKRGKREAPGMNSDLIYVGKDA